MTSSSIAHDKDSKGSSDSVLKNPFKNPSYPARDHFEERAQLDSVLLGCEQRLEAARQKVLSASAPGPQTNVLRLYHQLQARRDQLADTVRRLPLETGGLYREDKERYAQAVAAFERTWALWEKAAN